MLFNTSSKLSSKLDPGQVRAALVGKRIQIKELDFEFRESDGIIKVIPHTENDEKSRIVPITHVVLNKNGNGAQLEVSAKPRRIDIGGLYLATGSIILLALIAVYLRITYPEQTIWVSISVIATALMALGFLFARLKSGYYGYIGNIKNFIKQQVA